MSCRSGKTREYALTNRHDSISSPVSSLTSLRRVSSSDSPLHILPPANHHRPAAGLFFLLRKSKEPFITITASTEGIGICSVIWSYKREGIKADLFFEPIYTINSYILDLASIKNESESTNLHTLNKTHKIKPKKKKNIHSKA